MAELKVREHIYDFNIRRYNIGKFIKKPFCRHKSETVTQFIKLPYGYKALFICNKCGRARTTIC